MPFTARIERNGENLSLRWGWWHLEVMTVAVRQELNIEKGNPDYPLLDLWSRKDTQNGFTLSGDYTATDPDDGEVLELHVGDRLHVWREW